MKLAPSCALKESDQPTAILNLFASDMRDRALQVLSEFEAVKDWFEAQSHGDPPVMKFERTPAEREALPRFLAREAELKALTLATMADINYADIVPMEEGEYNQEQKEYWDLRDSEYSMRHDRLQALRTELWTLYEKSKRRRRLEAKNNAAHSQKTRPVTRSSKSNKDQAMEQSEQRDTGEQSQRMARDAARRMAKAHYRREHSINNIGGDVRGGGGEVDDLSTHPAEPKPRKRRAMRSRNQSSDEPRPLRRSTRISKKPDRFVPG
jgi:hypothetical protein